MYDDDFFNFRLTNKEMAAVILGVFVFVVAVFGCGYMLGIRNAGAGVHNNGDGTAGVGQQVEQAGTDIGHAADRIKEAAGSADKIRSGISNAKESAQYIQSTADTSAGLVAECQSIIGRVRSRGAQDPATH